jgi:hypothetical protein
MLSESDESSSAAREGELLQTGIGDQGNALRAYLTTLDHLRYEGQLLWHKLETFLLAHTVLLAFLLPEAFAGPQVADYRLGVFLAGLAGLLLCIPWAAAHSRSSAYYALRMAQAKEKEPPGWELLKGPAETFSAGAEVKLGPTYCRIGHPGRTLRTRRSVPLMITVFALLYFFIVVTSGPWW